MQVQNRPVEAPARPSVRAIVSHALKLTILSLAIGTLFIGRQAAAQGGGTIVSPGSEPFTETMFDMVKRQRTIPKLPNIFLPSPPEHDDELDKFIRNADLPPVSFIPPKFQGID